MIIRRTAFVTLNCVPLGGARETTVNVEIFAQYIFSRISRRALDA